MRLIDADALQLSVNDVLFIGERACKTKEMVEACVHKIVHNTPTIDAVEVVRCKDCKYFMEFTREYAKTTDGADGECGIKMRHSEDKEYPLCEYGDFCSYGKRRKKDAVN